MSVDRFQAPQAAISAALDKMKTVRLVHPEAEYDPDADRGLRTEVSYRDLDLLRELGRSPLETELVDAALKWLIERGVVPADAGYDMTAFEQYRAEIKENFKGSWTSITPVMERLMYMLASVKRAKRLVELGSFWGNTLAWFAGPCLGSSRVYAAEAIYGVEIDLAMHERTRENFAGIKNTEALHLIGEDAATALKRIEAPIDYLYLEAKDENNRNGYLEFLQQCYDKIPEGGWVIAHDSTEISHYDEMKSYLAWVRDPANFSHSFSFDIDMYGLELSIK